jgi:hypothetical protein
MRTLGLTAVALVLASAVPAAAQFPPPSPEQLKGAPFTPARLPDGHPNWTGFWITPNGLMDVYRGPSGITGSPPDQNTPTVRKDIPPLKSPYKERYQEAVRKSAEGTLPDPIAACFPPGMPAVMVMVYGMEILQTPNIISITSEWQAESRRIWMDLKQHPPAEELDPSYAGHSIGHWEGDTLVVDTVGLRSDVALDFTNLPHSDKTRIVERFSQLAPGLIVDDITVYDPDLFTAPWNYKMTYVHKANLRLKEYNCLENNRNVDAEGRAVFDK